MIITPLNGTKTHPIKGASLEALQVLARGPKPRQHFNPGVANRLERGGMAEEVDLPSPYASHKGRNIRHLRITAEGQRILQGDGSSQATAAED